jgi:tRNA pseudouridine55 synthase
MAAQSSSSNAGSSSAHPVPRPGVSGIVLLDKPEGLSSNAALQRVKRAFGAAKAGHAGTLDPLATGMLPILLGEATKLAGHLLHKDKAYSVGCRLGQSTTTYDAEGEVVEERPVPAVDAGRLDSALAAFTGRIRQRAPIYSAIKQGGQPLYRLARRGQDVVAPEREVEIRRIRIDDIRGDRVDLTVECGSGTYIRSLVHDLGQMLGCGAHVTRLRRLWVDPFRESAMVALDQVQAGAAPLLPLESALSGWPVVMLDDSQVLAVRQGRGYAPSGDPPVGNVAGLGPDGRLVALLELAADGLMRPLRVVNPA